MNKVLSIALALMLAISCLSLAVAEEKVYEATTPGHNAPITVAVTVDGDKIAKVEVTNENETIGVGKVAIDRMTQRIVDEQSLAVDVITGASITSRAILRGAEAALADSGLDLEALKAEPEKPAPQDAEYTGANVIVLEKLDILGGSTNVSEGALNAVDPERQGAQGIEDSVGKFIKQTYEGGHGVGDLELISYLCINSIDAVHWLESLGVEFKDEIGTATGALWQRSHYPSTPSGNSYIRVFEKYIAEHDDLTVMNGVTVNQILTDDSGAAIGVVGTAKDGATVTVKANSVILATGGFGANKDLLK